MAHRMQGGSGVNMAMAAGPIDASGVGVGLELEDGEGIGAAGGEAGAPHGIGSAERPPVLVHGRNRGLLI